jgi:hypothetical protein
MLGNKQHATRSKSFSKTPATQQPTTPTTPTKPGVGDVGDMGCEVGHGNLPSAMMAGTMMHI